MANKTLYYTGFVLIVAFMMTYVFWGADLIPDTLATVGPGLVAAWFDDAIVVIAGLFALSRWRQKTLGSNRDDGFGWKGAIIFIPFVALGLLYVFWTGDLIPDTISYVGWFDDAAAIMIMFYTLRKVREALKP